ncbi:uncharacterized protein METZ01_LOCUS78831 [marine metagenome]|uniref:Uncharacterized protein n=1 Tax=marine metagenome TaxID=408172 RepID=A0A381UF62_9ZZZZ
MGYYWTIKQDVELQQYLLQNPSSKY